MRRLAFMVALLLVLGATSAFGSAQIWDLGEGISVGATSDGQVTCVRYGASLNKTAIWSVQYGTKQLGTYTPTGITWKGSQLVVAGNLNGNLTGQAQRWDGNIQGTGTWSALPLADGLYNWRSHRVQSMASDGTNVWIVGFSTLSNGYEHACVYTDNGSTSACANAVLPSPNGHDHSELCAVSQAGLVAGQALYGGSPPTGGGRQVITGSPLRFLGTLMGNASSSTEARALAISGDGSRIVGWSYIQLDPLLIQQCYWDAPFTTNKAPHAIPFLDTYIWGPATAVSRTGTYIGGCFWRDPYPTPEGQAAWIWDAAHGTRDLKDVMIAEGADLTVWGRLCDDLVGTSEHGDGFFDITGISEDGRWITGTGKQSGVRHAYVAYLNEAPTVSAISPSVAPNTAAVNVTISGLVFRSGATVKLTRAGQSDIMGTSVSVTSLSTLTCSFNLTGKALGQWNVVVTNTDGQSGTLENGFAVVLPTSAPSYGTAIRSALDPIMATACGNYRFKFWGKATVLDTNTIQLDDGSPNTIKVIAPGHGITPGHFASAVGTLTTSAGEPVLLSSSSQVRALD
jgi:hypothetical protein